MTFYLGAALGIIAGGLAVFFYDHFTTRNAIRRTREESRQQCDTALRDAQSRAKEIEITAEQERLKLKKAAEAESSAAAKKLDEQEARLAKREDTLDRKLDTLSIKEKNLDQQSVTLTRRENAAAAREKESAGILEEQRRRLLEVAGMSADQAKELVLKRVEDEVAADAAVIVQNAIDHATDEAKVKSRQIILQAIQRYAAGQTADHTVSSVPLPDDAMKGRVIGKEGRNIRSFEKQTGVDVIIDDTPGVVVVSCFDPVRREIARMTMERLVVDGRIHPGRIEEVVAEATGEMDEQLLEFGKKAAVEANLPNLPKAVLPLLGRLSYRTSYGQNVLRHSLEVAYLCQVMADELGLDGATARRAGLLHDLGKAMDHDQEGGHPELGAAFLKKHGEAEAVVNAAAAHHGDVPATTAYTPLVMAADAISAARPGARRESYEKYVKRLHDLEDLALGFDGVRQVYAIQAGREIRVIADAKRLDDRASTTLARAIAKRVQEQLTYPGEIKITVLREVRTVEFAR